tara:strand:+ start:1842 stop:2579 length:738 start_codon:yes stop_codon:yes gene_type:complete
MADTKITDLTELTTIASADELAVVDDPAGSAATKKITKANLVKEIAVSDLANGTDGELITWGADAAPAAVAVGTATHVLTSNGAGAAPTFQAAAGGGKVLQVVSTDTGAVATGSTAFPIDDTIPQNTEGDEYMTLAITPAATNNILIIEAEAMGAHSVSVTRNTIALFQDSTANALQSGIQVNAGTNQPSIFNLRHVMAAGTTSETTFKIRMAGESGTFTLNGSSGTRFHGAIPKSSLIITEVEA